MDVRNINKNVTRTSKRYDNRGLTVEVWLACALTVVYPCIQCPLHPYLCIHSGKFPVIPLLLLFQEIHNHLYHPVPEWKKQMLILYNLVMISFNEKKIGLDQLAYTVVYMLRELSASYSHSRPVNYCMQNVG